MIAKSIFKAENLGVMRRIIIASLLISLTLLFPQSSNAAIKPGDICKAVGSTKKVGSTTLICKKQGKKTLWVKQGSSSSNAASPSKSPSPVASPSPSPSQKITSGLVPDYLTMNDPNDELALRVSWKSFDKRMSQAVSPKASVEIRTGAKTDKSRANEYLKSLIRSVAFWDDVYSPTKPVVAALSYSDEYAWMEDQWKRFGMNPKDLGGESSFTSGGASCNQGSAYLYNGLEPFFWGCLPSRGAIDVIGLQKFAGHEFTHIVQSHLIEWKTGRYKPSALPKLFMEGSAEFYGIATASQGEEEFLKNWNSARVNGYFGSPAEKSVIKDWNADKWLWALNENANNKLIPEAQGVLYYSGREITSRLVGLKGHEGFVSFMKQTESLQDWKKSFENIYAITWDEFSRKMSLELVEITKRLAP